MLTIQKQSFRKYRVEGLGYSIDNVGIKRLITWLKRLGIREVSLDKTIYTLMHGYDKVSLDADYDFNTEVEQH